MKGALCGRCGGTRKRSGRWPVTTCAECQQQICARHARYEPDGNQGAGRDVCTSCARRLGLKVIERV